MKLNLLALAIPGFILFMAVEYWVARQKKLPYFNLHNSVANISVGIAERLLDVYVTGFFFYWYAYLQTNFGVFDIKAGVFLWILLFLATDFIWYWYHRLAHEINLFWAVHVVHHQSEDFNYTVSARITVLQAFVRTGFWSILPLIGFPAGMITSVLLVHGLYPFFIHTRLIGNLGLPEYIFITPSHHRVHHASNEKYLDKNYGDVLVIWDKLFGTFKKEEKNEDIKFGLTKPLHSHSFLWQHFHFLVEIILGVKKEKGLKNKWKVVFGKPSMFDDSLREEAGQIFRIKQNKENDHQGLHRYVIWQLIITLLSLFVFILFEKNIPVTQSIIITSLILLTLINCGAIMEQKQWIFYLEFSRLLVAAIGIILLYPGLISITTTLLATTLVIYYFNSISEYYLQLIYKPQRPNYQ